MKRSKAIILGLVGIGLFSALPGSLWAAKLAAAAASVTDAVGMSRTSFSSSERISLVVQVQNTAVGSSNIQFTFEVKDPMGNRRLYQTGNSAPSTVVGVARSSLSGIPISQFYNSPGLYTLTVTATLDGETAQASASFTIFSPLITLAYPPNGARDLIDQPLIFRWVSSGASAYRVSVGIDSSFYKTLFAGQSMANFLAYPLNPTDELQRLSAGQTYYWKVEGLDGLGNVVTKTDIPFSFTVKSQSPQSSSKDLAIVNVDRINEAVPGAAGAVPMAVYVKNQGGKSEGGVFVSFYADGAAAPTSPKRIDMIAPGQTLQVVFPIRPPEEDRAVIVNASLDFLDDNMQNNRFSKSITRDTREKKYLEPSQVWDVLKRFVKDASILSELEGSELAEVVGDGISDEEVNKLILAVKAGKAHVTDVKFKADK